MLQIIKYTSKSELQRTHPEIKSFSVAMQIPHGMTSDEAIHQELHRRNIQERVYQVGNFIWKPAQCTPKVKS